MSAGAHKASFTYTGGPALFFNTLKSEQGWPEDQPVLVTKKLISAGGDGARDADVYFQYPDWEFTTTADDVSLDAVRLLRDAYKAAQRISAVGTLRVDLDGVFRVFRGLKILDVFPIVSPGSAAGFGAVSNSNGVIIAKWRTRFTEVPSTF